MNELIQKSVNELTMSSREISTLTGKKHYNVMRDIELLAAQLEVDVSKFGGIYTDSQNREQTEYLLDKDTCLCLVAGYNAKLRLKIIKRWQELEQATLPTTQEQFKDIVFSPYQTFNFDADFVRVVVDDTNNPLFVAKDVATVLGYSDTTNAIKQHCKGVAKHHPIADRMGRCQEMRVITEPDVYRLVFGSKLETAERFQDWVFSEVLPQIRRTGAYEVQAPTPTDPLLLIAHLAQSAYEIQQKQVEMDNRLIKVEQKQQQLNQDNDHFTIKGFCSLHQLDLSNGKMSALSRKAKKLSDVKDYTYHEITDPRWGKVRTYHKDILTELFEFEQLI